MNRTTRILSFSPAARVRIAGAASGLAVLLTLGFAHAPQAENSSEAEKPPASAPRIAAQEAPAALRTYAYYPEQLAALQSLGQFQPIADAGQKPEPQAVALAAAVRPAAGDAKAARRAEPTAKPAAAKAIPAPAAVAPSPAPENPVKIFSEAAAGLGGKIASLWR
jgi:hypothetical protein